MLKIHVKELFNIFFETEVMNVWVIFISEA